MKWLWKTFLNSFLSEFLTGSDVQIVEELVLKIFRRRSRTSTSDQGIGRLRFSIACAEQLIVLPVKWQDRIQKIEFCTLTIRRLDGCSNQQTGYDCRQTPRVGTPDRYSPVSQSNPLENRYISDTWYANGDPTRMGQLLPARCVSNEQMFVVSIGKLERNPVESVVKRNI